MHSITRKNFQVFLNNSSISDRPKLNYRLVLSTQQWECMIDPVRIVRSVCEQSYVPNWAPGSVKILKLVTRDKASYSVFKSETVVNQRAPGSPFLISTSPQTAAREQTCRKTSPDEVTRLRKQKHRLLSQEQSQGREIGRWGSEEREGGIGHQWPEREESSSVSEKAVYGSLGLVPYSTFPILF